MLKSLQAGRGIAALAVCAFHLSIFFGDPRYGGKPILSQFTWFGNLGVDFFFVLSGFIIMYAHERDIGNPAKLSSYFFKRFVRLFPVYWLYTTVFSALVLAGIGGTAALPESLAQWLTTYSLIRFSSLHVTLHPAWTLFHEVAFYAIFACLIANRKIGLVLLVCWSAVIIAFFQYADENNRSAFLTYFSAYNLDFILGMFSYLFFKNIVYSEYVKSISISITVLGLLLFFIFLYLDFYFDVSNLSPLLFAISFALILTGVTTVERSFGFINSPLIILAGDASYTIYLTHEPVMGVFMKIFYSLQMHIHLRLELVYFIVFICSICTCCVMYTFVEVSLLKFIRSHTSNFKKM